MTLKEIADTLSLDVKTGASELNREVTGGYASDLLSDVIANAQEGNIWVTLHIHLNIVAIASMKELAGIIIVSGREVPEETLLKAGEENVPVLISSMTTFELVGRLYALGISG